MTIITQRVVGESARIIQPTPEEPPAKVVKNEALIGDVGMVGYEDKID